MCLSWCGCDSRNEYILLTSCTIAVFFSGQQPKIKSYCSKVIEEGTYQVQNKHHIDSTS